MNAERLLTVVRAPHISEKATVIAEKHKQFVFEVARDATKGEIKQAVEHLFSVQVEAVRVCNVKGKVKRSGRFVGRRVNWKKAYVSLKSGFDIDFTGGK